MNFLKDSSLYVLGEIGSKIIPFLLLPYISRKMGVENYGELAYYQTWIYIFGIFLLLSQDASITRYFYFYGKNAIDLIIVTGYTYTIVLGTLIFTLCFFYKQELLAYAVITAIFSSFISIQLSLRQCQKKAYEYIKIQFLSTIISVTITVLVLEIFTNHIVKYRILGALVANIITLLIISIFYNKSSYKFFSKRQYKISFMYILGLGLPLVLHHLNGFLRGQLDRIFIYNLFSKTDLGLYSMGVNLASIQLLLIMSINKAIIPYYYDGLKNKTISLKNIKNWFFYSLSIGPILTTIIVYFIPEDFFIWVLGNDFNGVKYYFSMFCFSASLIPPYFILINYLHFYGKNKLITISSSVATVCYLMALLFLIFYCQKIEYIPFASILGNVIMLPILWNVINKLSKEIEKSK